MKILNINEFADKSKTVDESLAGKQILHFKDIYSYVLFNCEYSGQVSDGKYENSRPYNHYKWVIDPECVIDGNEYYEGGQPHSIKYTFGSWDKYVRKALSGQSFDYDFVVRDYYMCKLASVLPEDVVKQIVDTDNFAFEFIASDWGDYTMDGDDYNTMIMSNPYYRKNANRVSVLSSIDNEQVYNDFAASDYSVEDFIAARISAENTMNIRR